MGWLRERGYEVRLGEHLVGEGVTSASPRARAAELAAMLCDPEIAAVVPPWGGELAVEVLPHLDLEAISRAEATWLVGYSDISTVLLPLTLLAGVATIHGHNLMETPYRLPEQVMSWHAVAGLPAGATFVQSAPPRLRSAAAGFDRWETAPEMAAITEYTLDEVSTGWSRLDETDRPVDVSGRLIGGCVETVAPLAGTRWGDVRTLTGDDERLIVYLEVAESGALDAARALWAIRLAGWFDTADAVLIGRTHAPPAAGFSQRDAVASALSDLDVPVILDVDCGHVVPAMAFVNGARARVIIDNDRASITQTLG